MNFDAITSAAVKGVRALVVSAINKIDAVATKVDASRTELAAARDNINTATATAVTNARDNINANTNAARDNVKNHVSTVVTNMGSGIKSVQRGVAVMQWSNVLNVTIAAVNMSKAELRLLGAPLAQNGNGGLKVAAAQLTSSTNIRIEGPPDNTGEGWWINVSWELTEWQ